MYVGTKHRLNQHVNDGDMESMWARRVCGKLIIAYLMQILIYESIYVLKNLYHVLLCAVIVGV